jgi:excisionase family DNA binding protein
MFMNGKNYLRPSQAAKLLGVHRTTVYRWFWEGKLRGIKMLGGTVRILESSLNDLVSEGDF